MISEKKKNEIIVFLWLSLALFLLLCLVSYVPEDVSFNVSRVNQPVKNFVGIAGAHLSWALNFAIGRGAYFLVLLFCFWALAQWSERKKQRLWLRLFSGALFFISACSSLSLLAGPDADARFQAGGLVGFFVASILIELFGKAALLFSFVLFVLALLLATEFMVFPLVGALLRWFWGHFRVLGKTAQGALTQGPATTSSRKEPKIVRPEKGAIRPERPVAAGGALQKARELLKGKGKDTAPKPDAAPKPVIRTLATRKPQETAPAKAGVVKPVAPRGDYKLPSTDLLSDPQAAESGIDAGKFIEEQSRVLQDTLSDFGIDARVVEAEQGPVITRFELQPASGVKLQRITSLQDNIALALEATSVRILAPIPGKARIGIEVPNPAKQNVVLKDIMHSANMRKMESKLAFAIGKDAAGEPVVADLDQMPHLLIAGSTGSGKTVCINAIISSMLFRSYPDEVKFIMIDPKMVELIGYNGLPHLLTPVITQIDRVPTVMNWLVSEMENRYKILSKFKVRDMEGYNERVEKDPGIRKIGDIEYPERIPYIVVIIDELADLMMTQGKEVESAIMRLAQLARAVGIHMILATQRPSVDVITGVIKANFQSRIAFQVASKVDSRTVLDQNGAECLLGKGDFLYMDPSKPHLLRGQGAWVADPEIERLVEACKEGQNPVYDEEILKASSKRQGQSQDFRSDEHYEEACRIIVSSQLASVSMLQRRLGLGYTRAARLVDMMEEDGIVGPHRGSKAREVLVSIEELDARFKNAGGESGTQEGAGQ
ncbi:MAG: DNA translocase FtsK 4TM domain-containing protein [Candidatus Omnitrophica bacterium]|nr:DNA translocase FtsK 4TM domain-containing protein [Candidatus Omnitrophota bacterium]